MHAEDDRTTAREDEEHVDVEELEAKKERAIKNRGRRRHGGRLDVRRTVRISGEIMEELVLETEGGGFIH